jgi:hypothetical protein
MAGIQTTYPTTRALGFAGGLADNGPHDVKSVIAEAAIAAGLVVIKGSTPAKGDLPQAPDAADADGIIATAASAATAQVLSGVSLDGAQGGDRMKPPRNVVLVLSSHADWDATVATVTGLNDAGDVIQEDLLIPNGGNATVTGALLFASVTSLYIPAQSGTGGTCTLGFGALLGAFTGRDVHGVALYDAGREPEAYPVGYPVPCARKGRVFVTSETSYVDGDPVFVRLVAAGAEVAGHVRNAPDSNDCVLLKGATFWRTGSAGVAAIDLDLS